MLHLIEQPVLDLCLLVEKKPFLFVQRSTTGLLDLVEQPFDFCLEISLCVELFNDLLEIALEARTDFGGVAQNAFAIPQQMLLIERPVQASMIEEFKKRILQTVLH